MILKQKTPCISLFAFLGSISLIAAMAAITLLPACSRGGRNSAATSGTDSQQVEDGTLLSMAGGHVAIYLRDNDGNAIDIETDTVPFSTKQTCGYCHDYDVISEGFHFQQGGEELDDDYGTDNGSYPWVSSPGMVGKW